MNNIGAVLDKMVLVLIVLPVIGIAIFFVLQQPLPRKPPMAGGLELIQRLRKLLYLIEHGAK